ncbi:MAG: hypothetical protein AAGJ87_09675, partial [Pseudomonadota bacterium]
MSAHRGGEGRVSMVTGKIGIGGMIALAAAALASTSAAAQGGGAQPVPDITHCEKGECIVIGKRTEPSKPGYFNVHLFPEGGVPRKRGSRRKLQPNYFDSIEEAVAALGYFSADELDYCAPKGRVRSTYEKKTQGCESNKIGRVYVHPGQYRMRPVVITNYPQSIIFEGAETDIAPAILMPQTGRCFTVTPRYAQNDDGTDLVTKVGFKSLIIGWNASAPAGAAEETCIETSRVGLDIENVQFHMNGHKGRAVHIFNNKAKIKNSEFLSSPFGGAERGAPPLEAGTAIKTEAFANLELTGSGPTQKTIEGFQTGLDARSSVNVKGAFFSANYTSVLLRRSETVSTKTLKKSSSIDRSLIRVDGGLFDGDSEPAVGVFVSKGYDGDVSLVKTTISAGAFSDVGTGLFVDDNLAADRTVVIDGQAAVDGAPASSPSESSAFVNLPIGVDARSSVSMTGVSFAT